MGALYQRSWGDDEFEGEFRCAAYEVKYDRDACLWVCSCVMFADTGKCKHVYRFTREVVVCVNEKFL